MSVVVSYKKQFTFFLMLLIMLLVVVEISIRTFEYSGGLCADWDKEYQIPKQVCLDFYLAHQSE